MYSAEDSLTPKKMFKRLIPIIGIRMENQISNTDLFIKCNIQEKTMIISLHFKCMIETSLKAMT